SSNSIVRVLDLFIFPENRRLAKTKGIEQLGPENAYADLVDALVTVLRQSEQGRGVSGKQGRISTPLAVVVTKMDAFWQDLDEHSPLRSHGQDVPYFDDVDSQTIHDHLLSLVSQWEDPVSSTSCRRSSRTSASSPSPLSGTSPCIPMPAWRRDRAPAGCPTRCCGCCSGKGSFRSPRSSPSSDPDVRDSHIHGCPG